MIRLSSSITACTCYILQFCRRKMLLSGNLVRVSLLADHCVILVVAVVGISESKKKYKLFTDNNAQVRGCLFLTWACRLAWTQTRGTRVQTCLCVQHSSAGRSRWTCWYKSANFVSDDNVIFLHSLLWRKVQNYITICLIITCFRIYNGYEDRFISGQIQPLTDKSD